MSAVMNKENRRGERLSLALSAVVKAKESKDSFWKETTELVSISRSGAGFYLTRQCQVGQLVSLLIAMPRRLRCYDHDKELYRVWGLVQHCSPFSGHDEKAFHIGIAFVGKSVPSSYSENPLQSYRITGMNEDGMWKIVEAKTSFVIRRHSRYWVSMEILLTTEDADKNLLSDKKAVTENISMSGAAVFSDLPVEIGDSLNFNCDQHDFSALAIVRNRQTYEYELPKLHLEFIEANFPMEQLVFPGEKDIFDEDEILNGKEENSPDAEDDPAFEDDDPMFEDDDPAFEDDDSAFEDDDEV